jgi:hypothetical protein
MVPPVPIVFGGYSVKGSCCSDLFSRIERLKRLEQLERLERDERSEEK